MRSPCCDKSKVKKGPWSPVEDMILTNFIQKNGHDNWRSLPKQAGLLRCGKSCRLRWINYLRPDVKRGNFTPEEEDTIIKLHSSLGNKWSKIASVLPGRTDNEIKNVWNKHLKKKSCLHMISNGSENCLLFKNDSSLNGEFSSVISTTSSSSSKFNVLNGGQDMEGKGEEEEGQGLQIDADSMPPRDQKDNFSSDYKAESNKEAPTSFSSSSSKILEPGREEDMGSMLNSMGFGEVYNPPMHQTAEDRAREIQILDDVFLEIPVIDDPTDDMDYIWSILGNLDNLESSNENLTLPPQELITDQKGRPQNSGEYVGHGHEDHLVPKSEEEVDEYMKWLVADVVLS